MVHALSLGVILFVLWLLLSGIYTPMLIGFGVFSCLLVVVVALRMDVVDHEGRPMHLSISRWLLYMFWLVGEIIKSSIDVARCILDPALPISPRVFRVKTGNLSMVAQVAYANSITLTPGTVSIDLEGDEIEVHALTEAGFEGLQTGEMLRRVSNLERRVDILVYGERG